MLVNCVNFNFMSGRLCNLLGLSSEAMGLSTLPGGYFLVIFSLLHSA